MIQVVGVVTNLGLSTASLAPPPAGERIEVVKSISEVDSPRLPERGVDTLAVEPILRECDMLKSATDPTLEIKLLLVSEPLLRSDFTSAKNAFISSSYTFLNLVQ